MQARSTVANEDGEDGHGWDHAGWSYEGPTGPQYWGTLTPDYAQCSSGTPSPQSINSPRTNQSDFKSVLTLQEADSRPSISSSSAPREGAALSQLAPGRCRVIDLLLIKQKTN